MRKGSQISSGIVGIAGIPTLLTGVMILSDQGRNSPWGWLTFSVGLLLAIGGSALWLLLARDSGDVERRPTVEAKSDRGSRTLAAGRDWKMRDYYEAPTPAPPITEPGKNINDVLAELRQTSFALGSNGRRFDLSVILLMAGDRLVSPTSMMTFQATIQTAIPDPDKPVDHKDVPPEILSEYVLLDVLELISAGYQLTTLGKAVVRALRAERSTAEQNERLAEIYNGGKQLLLFEKDYAHPPPPNTLGGVLYSDLVNDEFRKWDHPAQQFIRDRYGVAKATLYGNTGFPIRDGETIFDLIRARLKWLEPLMT